MSFPFTVSVLQLKPPHLPCCSCIWPCEGLWPSWGQTVKNHETDMFSHMDLWNIYRSCATNTFCNVYFCDWYQTFVLTYSTIRLFLLGHLREKRFAYAAQFPVTFISWNDTLTVTRCDKSLMSCQLADVARREGQGHRSVPEEERTERTETLKLILPRCVPGPWAENDRLITSKHPAGPIETFEIGLWDKGSILHAIFTDSKLVSRKLSHVYISALLKMEEW